MGCAYKFLGFSISYTILNLPLFCTYQLCFLFPGPFPLFVPFPLPIDSAPNDLHIHDSLPILVVYLLFFRFSC